MEPYSKWSEMVRRWELVVCKYESKQRMVTWCLRGPTGRQSHKSPVLTNSIPSRQLFIVRESPLIQNCDGSPGYGSYGHGAVNIIGFNWSYDVL